jgi:hypothetical protein
MSNPSANDAVEPGVGGEWSESSGNTLNPQQSIKEYGPPSGTMTYATSQDVRDLLGLTIDEAPDDIMDGYILRAQNVVLHYIQVEVRREQIALDASGQTVQVSHPFLADTNFDKVVDDADVQVWGWMDSDHIDTVSTLPIDAVWPEDGIVRLTGSAQGFQMVTVNYSYYTCAIDWTLVTMAVAYYAGVLWVAREEFLVPEQLTIGNITIRQNQPWNKIRTEFDRMIFHITALPMDITNYRKIGLTPRRWLRLRGPGTTYELDDRYTGYNQRDIT